MGRLAQRLYDICFLLAGFRPSHQCRGSDTPAPPLRGRAPPPKSQPQKKRGRSRAFNGL